MSVSVKTPVRVLGKALFPLALALALAPSVATPALADGNASITGKVSATPAKYLGETVVFIKNAANTGGAHTASVDQKGMTFVPHVLAVTAGDTVNYLNHDSMPHNVFSSDNEGFNLGTFAPGETRSYTFKTAGLGYSELCSIHPEMLGYVFVAPSQFKAVVDGSGNFTINNVPPGTYNVSVWNSKLKAGDQSVTVAAGAASSVSFSLTH